jgi:glycosyltransferase involved in cell wall biosynthesis
MNLAFATSFLYPDNFGGINTYVHELARHFSSAGHTVAVVGPNFDGRPMREDFEGYRIYRFPSGGKRWLTRNRLTLSNFRKAAREVHREMVIDRWISNDLFSGLAAQRWIKRYPAPWTVVCHSLNSAETYVENASRSDRSRALLRSYCAALRTLERHLYRKTQDLVVLSSFTQKQIHKVLGLASPIAIIPGGVDIRRFSPVSERERLAIRVRLGIPQDRPCLLTVRRLEWRMGLFLLMDALDVLRQSGMQFISIVGGDGSLKQALTEYRHQRNLGDYVRFEGLIPAADLADYYRAADLFVLPTTELEGWGLTIAEAMACGCPVVGTPVGNIMQILQAVTPQFLSQDLSAPRLCQTIQYALGRTTTELRSQLVQYSAEHLSWHRVVRYFERHWALPGRVSANALSDDAQHVETPACRYTA